MTENGAQARRCATGAWRVNKQQQHRSPVCRFQTALRNAQRHRRLQSLRLIYCTQGDTEMHTTLVRRTRHLWYRRERSLRTPALYLFRVSYRSEASCLVDSEEVVVFPRSVLQPFQARNGSCE